MKIKSTFASIFVSLLALVIVFAVSSPTAAQKVEKKEKTSEGMIAKKTTDAGDESKMSSDKTVKTPSTEKPVSDKKTAAGPQDANYWFEKGALCATYGNDRAAIKFFQKAISLDPKRSAPYFEQGISYGQLGEFDKAMTLVNQAIEMEPQNGLYLYGRGRVQLLAGETEKAMQDFKKAAELDDEDAQAYLEHVADF